MIIEIICPRCGCKFTGLGFFRDKVLYCCETCADGGDCECEGCADEDEPAQLAVAGNQAGGI
jgi:hypothetical protein